MTTALSPHAVAAPAAPRTAGLLGAAMAVAVACACVGGLAAGWQAARPAAAAAAAAPAAGATKVELGREVCGECCETRIWSAIGSLPGVHDVVVEVGSSQIVVHHDAAAGAAERLVAGLRQREYPEARRVGDAVDAQGRVWIRPVAPPR
jgi:hypothetical protein